MKKKLPDTSIDAYKQVHPEMLAEHYRKIISSLSVLGIANYEKIAAHNGMDRHQVGRRLKELEEMQLIYKPGTKTPTKTRMAYDYCLTGQGMPKTDNEVKYSNKEMTAADHALKLINLTKQPELFT